MTLHPGLRLVFLMVAVPVDTITGLALAMSSHNPFPALAVHRPDLGADACSPTCASAGRSCGSAATPDAARADPRVGDLGPLRGPAGHGGSTRSSTRRPRQPGARARGGPRRPPARRGRPSAARPCARSPPQRTSTPSRAASTGSPPRASAKRKPAANRSPAPLVSTTSSTSQRGHLDGARGRDDRRRPAARSVTAASTPSSSNASSARSRVSVRNSAHASFSLAKTTSTLRRDEVEEVASVPLHAERVRQRQRDEARRRRGCARWRRGWPAWRAGGRTGSPRGRSAASGRTARRRGPRARGCWRRPGGSPSCAGRRASRSRGSGPCRRRRAPRPRGRARRPGRRSRGGRPRRTRRRRSCPRTRPSPPSEAMPAIVLAADPPEISSRRTHRVVDPRRPLEVDERHRALGQPEPLDELVVARRDHVDERVADAHDVERARAGARRDLDVGRLPRRKGRAFILRPMTRDDLAELPTRRRPRSPTRTGCASSPTSTRAAFDGDRRDRRRLAARARADRPQRRRARGRRRAEAVLAGRRARSRRRSRSTRSSSARRCTFARELPSPAGPSRCGSRSTARSATTSSGFYRSTYTDADGIEQAIATTQLAATDARRAFPCFDEPALKATFEITLVVPEGLAAYSNSPVGDRDRAAPTGVARSDSLRR